MLKSTNKGFQVQKKENCRNYNWCKDNKKHCAIPYSDNIEKPVNAYVVYNKCSLEEGSPCNHFNCGVQLTERK